MKKERTRNLNSKESERKAPTIQKLLCSLTYFKEGVIFKVFSNTFILIHFNTGFYFLFTKATNGEKMDNQEFGLKHIPYQSDHLEHQRSPMVPQPHHRFDSSKLIQQTCTHAEMKYITRKKADRGSHWGISPFSVDKILIIIPLHRPLSHGLSTKNTLNDEVRLFYAVMLHVSIIMLNL